MNPVQRYGGSEVGATPTSVGATLKLIAGHFASPQEAGALRFLDGYLTRDGQVHIDFFDHDLWRKVQVSEAELDGGYLKAETIRNLTRGCDAKGTRILREVRGGFHRLRHGIVTLFPSVSHLLSERAAELHALELLWKLEEHWHRSLCSMAVRVSSGGHDVPFTQRVRIESGRVLMGAVAHGTNQLGEPHHHSHPFVFPHVFCNDQKWRSLETSAHASWMQKAGREEAARITADHLAQYGYQLIWTPGFARDLEEDIPDATIICPGKRVIEAGSDVNQRTIEVGAWREILAQFRGREACWVEVEKIRKILRVSSEEELLLVVSFAGIDHATAVDIDRAFARAETVALARYPPPRRERISDYIWRLRMQLASTSPGLPQDEHDREAWDLQAAHLLSALQRVAERTTKTTPLNRAETRILRRHQLIQKGSFHDKTYEPTDLGHELLGSNDPHHALGALLLAGGAVRGERDLAPEFLPGAAGGSDAAAPGHDHGTGSGLGCEDSGSGTDQNERGGTGSGGDLPRAEPPRRYAGPSGLRRIRGDHAGANGEGHGRGGVSGSGSSSLGRGPSDLFVAGQFRALAGGLGAAGIEGRTLGGTDGAGSAYRPGESGDATEGPRGLGRSARAPIPPSEGGNDAYGTARDSGDQGEGRGAHDLGPLAVPCPAHAGRSGNPDFSDSGNGDLAGNDRAQGPRRNGDLTAQAVQSGSGSGLEAHPSGNHPAGNSERSSDGGTHGGTLPKGDEHALRTGLEIGARGYGKTLPVSKQGPVLGAAALTHRASPTKDRFQRGRGASPMRPFGHPMTPPNRISSAPVSAGQRSQQPRPNAFQPMHQRKGRR